MLAAAVMPILLIGFGLMLYNYLRFDNPLEFGQHYQMAGNEVHNMPHMLSLKYFWFNFRVYFSQPIPWGGSFPFVGDIIDDINSRPAPAGYLGIEYPVGILTNLPLVLMALAVPLAWKKRTAGEQSVLRLYMAILGVFCVISALPLCLFAGACLRYQVDFVPALMLLAMGGVLGLERDLTAKPWWRGVGRCVWIGALLFSVMVNLLMSCKVEARQRFLYGLDQHAQSQLKEAISSLQESLRMDPSYAAIHCDLAIFLVEAGRLPEAIDQYEQTLGINPNFPGAWKSLLEAEQKLQHPAAKPPN
jgi:tetratricopeptide (TPR) repeat protein